MINKPKYRKDKHKDDKLFSSKFFLEENENRFGVGGLRVKGKFKSNNKGMPLVSIITVVFNGEKYLEETIQSVISQTYTNIEYIIIDGGSTDSTLAIIKNFEDHVDYWISEKDEGMYDALNKGISLASGEIIGFLNSDDTLEDFAISVISDKFMADLKCEAVFGNLNIIDEQSNIIKKRKSMYVTFEKLLISEHGTYIPQPTFYIRTKALREKIGLHDLKYKYASDYDYLLRCIKTLNYCYIDKRYLNFRYHDESITMSGKLDAERKKILIKHSLCQIPQFKRLFFYYFNWLRYKFINIFG